MITLRSSLLLASVPLLLAPLYAAENRDAAHDMKPAMSQRGKLLFSDDFSAPALAAHWKKGPGQWDIVDGTLKGVELEANHHAAVVRTRIAYHDAIFQFAFRLDGGKQTSLSLNDANGHVCRVFVRPDGISVNRDKPNAKSTEKAMVLDSQKGMLEPGRWYNLLVEVSGNRMLARVEGTPLVAYGEHDAINGEKVDFGLPVGGNSISFDNIRVWEGTPAKGWDKSKIDILRKAH